MKVVCALCPFPRLRLWLYRVLGYETHAVMCWRCRRDWEGR